MREGVASGRAGCAGGSTVRTIFHGDWVPVSAGDAPEKETAMNNDLKKPTAEQCSTGALVPVGDGRTGMAIWYPQMGGYVGAAVVVAQGGCFDAYVWHDGGFPFADETGPTRLHHCSPLQFIEFGKAVERFVSGLSLPIPPGGSGGSSFDDPDRRLNRDTWEPPASIEASGAGALGPGYVLRELPLGSMSIKLGDQRWDSAVVVGLPAYVREASEVATGETDEDVEALERRKTSLREAVDRQSREFFECIQSAGCPTESASPPREIVIRGEEPLCWRSPHAARRPVIGSTGASERWNAIGSMDADRKKRAERREQAFLIEERGKLHELNKLWEQPGKEGGLRPGQIPPPGDWKVWIVISGRGSGKDHTGCAWVRSEVDAGARNLAIIVPRSESEDAEAIAAAIIASFPAEQRPDLDRFLGVIHFSTGATATFYTADRPSSFLGEPHDRVWGNDVSMWGNDPAILRQIKRWAETGRVLLTSGAAHDGLLNDVVLDIPHVRTKLEPSATLAAFYRADRGGQ